MVNNYYQKHKERLQKEHMKDIKNFLKEKKKKSFSIIVNIIRIFLRNESKSKLSI